MQVKPAALAADLLRHDQVSSSQTLQVLQDRHAARLEVRAEVLDAAAGIVPDQVENPPPVTMRQRGEHGIKVVGQHVTRRLHIGGVLSSAVLRNVDEVCAEIEDDSAGWRRCPRRPGVEVA